MFFLIETVPFRAVSPPLFYKLFSCIRLDAAQWGRRVGIRCGNGFRLPETLSGKALRRLIAA